MSDVTFQVAGFGAVGLLATLKQLLAAVAASIPKGADSVWSGRMFARRDERGKHETHEPGTHPRAISASKGARQRRPRQDARRPIQTDGIFIPGQAFHQLLRHHFLGITL